MSDEEAFERWLDEGYARGWVREGQCATHDDLPDHDEDCRGVLWLTR